MKVDIAPPEFRPITITLETEDELDQLLAVLTVLSNAAESRVIHSPPIVAAARRLRTSLHQALNGEI